MIEYVYISLGSNSGDRWKYIGSAVKEFQAAVGVSVLMSSLYETEPWGVKDQPEFLNCVIGFNFTASRRLTGGSEPGYLKGWSEGKEPFAVLDLLGHIEELSGRDRSGSRWGQRTLDADILMFGARQLHTDTLVLPHPRILSRRFVLQPLAEIAPDMQITGTGLTVSEALEICDDRCAVREVAGDALI